MSKQIEDVIREALEGEAQRNALDFIAWLRAKEIPFNQMDNYLDVYFNGKNVCNVLVTGEEKAPGPWTIWSGQEPGSSVAWADAGEDGAAVDQKTKEIAWANLNYCANCGGDCAPGRRQEVLGKAFDGLCSSVLAFTSPGGDALDCAKKMVAARKSDIVKNTSPAQQG